MHDATLIEDQQKGRYPGLRVRRDGDGSLGSVEISDAQARDS